MRTLLICAISLFSTTPTVAQDLWQASKVGMTFEQIKAAYPNSIVPSDPEVLKDRGMVERLRIPNFEVANSSYKVVFQFGDNGLQMVKLEPSAQLTLADAEFQAANLLPLLRARYGPELAGSRQKMGLMTFIEYTWIQGRTRIKMNIFGGLPSALFNVVYTGDGSEAAGKL